MEEKIHNLVNKYIQDHPISEISYVLSSKQHFFRDHNYCYHLLPEQEIGPISLGEKVIFKSLLFRDQEQKKTIFYISPLGPTEFYINGKLVYSGVNKKVSDHPGHGYKVTADTPYEKNELLIVTKKTNSGIGAIFGTGSSKGDPFFVLKPTEISGELIEEGWKYEKISGKDLLETNYEFLGETKDSNILKDLSNENKGYVIGGADIFLREKSTVIFSELPETSGLIIDQEKIDLKKEINLSAGKHQIFVKLTEYPKTWPVKITVSGKEIPTKSFFDFKESWSYLGPLREEREDFSDLTQVVEGKYWQVYRKDLIVRPFLKSKVFGRWSYPIGVTLKGLVDYGLHFKDEKILSYVFKHLKICTSFYDYSLWDKKSFGAPLINFSLSMMDSLDDCGSMAYTLLYFSNHMSDFLPGAKKVLKDCAHYILKEQRRLPDGTLYREGTNLILEKTIWADDLYMSQPFLSLYGKNQGVKSYFTKINQEFSLFLKRLKMPDKNYYAHVYDVSLEKNTNIPWGRGNGWILLSLAIALENNPLEEQKYLKEIFSNLLKGFADNLGEDGFWHQVLSDVTSYAETSVTMIALIALGKNLAEKWVESPFSKENVFKLYENVLERVLDEESNLTGVCRGSGYSFDPDYYKERLRPKTNDLHGIGLVLSCYCQLDKLNKGSDQVRDVPYIVYE